MDRSRLEMVNRAKKLLHRESPEDVEKALEEMKLTPKQMQESLRRFIASSSTKVLVINPTRTVKMVPEVSVNLGKDVESLKIGPYVFSFGSLNKAKNKRATKILGRPVCGEVIVKGAVPEFELSIPTFMKWEGEHNKPKADVCKEELDAVSAALGSALEPEDKIDNATQASE